jgi:hypothetical protein
MEKHEVWRDEKFFEAGDQEIFGSDFSFQVVGLLLEIGFKGHLFLLIYITL